MSIVEIKSDINQYLKKAGSSLAIIYFYVTWCENCTPMYHLYKSLSEKYNWVFFYTLDCDINKDLCYKEGINGFPSFKFYLSEKMVEYIKGPLDSDFSLESKIQLYSKEPPNRNSDYALYIEHTKKLISCIEKDNSILENSDLKFLVDFVHKYFPVTIEQEKIELPPPPTQKAPSISIYKSDMSNDELPFPEVPTLLSIPNNEELYNECLTKFNLAVEQGNYDKALEYINSTLKYQQTSYVFHKRAELLLKSKRPKAAICDCNRALKINPDSAKALKIRGKSYKMIGDLTKALDDFKRACFLDYDDETHQLQVEIENNIIEMNERNNNNDYDINDDESIYRRLNEGCNLSLTEILNDSIISEALLDMEVNMKFRSCLTHPEERIKYQSDPKMKRLLQRLSELENN